MASRPGSKGKTLDAGDEGRSSTDRFRAIKKRTRKTQRKCKLLPTCLVRPPTIRRRSEESRRDPLQNRTCPNPHRRPAPPRLVPPPDLRSGVLHRLRREDFAGRPRGHRTTRLARSPRTDRDRLACFGWICGRDRSGSEIVLAS